MRFASARRAKASLPLALIRPLLLRVAAWIDLVGGMGWTTGAGEAVAMLAGPEKRSHLRQVTVAAGVMTSAVVALVVATNKASFVLAVGLGVPVFIGFAWTAVASWRTAIAVAPQRRLRPPGSYFLYGLAASAAAPGAGRQLMRAVCDEADEHGWVLCLEAPGTMPRYYADFEFSAVEPARAMPWGETMTVMARQPRKLRGAPDL